MRRVFAAAVAISTSGEDEAIEGMPWCSAYQTRVKPRSSPSWRGSRYSAAPRRGGAVRHRGEVEDRERQGHAPLYRHLAMKCQPGRPWTSCMKIAVIGSGVSGIAAGKTLKRFGHEVVIYERAADRRRLGHRLSGRARCRTSPSIIASPISPGRSRREPSDGRRRSAAISRRRSPISGSTSGAATRSRRWTSCPMAGRSRSDTPDGTRTEEFDYVLVATGHYTDDKTAIALAGARRVQGHGAERARRARPRRSSTASSLRSSASARPRSTWRRSPWRAARRCTTFSATRAGCMPLHAGRAATSPTSSPRARATFFEPSWAHPHAARDEVPCTARSQACRHVLAATRRRMLAAARWASARPFRSKAARERAEARTTRRAGHDPAARHAWRRRRLFSVGRRRHDRAASRQRRRLSPRRREAHRRHAMCRPRWSSSRSATTSRACPILPPRLSRDDDARGRTACSSIATSSIRACRASPSPASTTACSTSPASELSARVDRGA